MIKNQKILDTAEQKDNTRTFTPAISRFLHLALVTALLPPNVDFRVGMARSTAKKAKQHKVRVSVTN